MSQAAERWDLSYTQNRELSWLAFDQRVLEEAADPSVPLMERLRFLSIFTSNLDEFFMVRVGSLTDLALVAPNARENKGGFSPAEQLRRIYAAVVPLVQQRDQVYRELIEALAEHGVADIPYKELKNGEREYVRAWYREAMRPLLMPQIIDPSHPFPHLKNKTLYAAALLREGDKRRLGIVGVPDVVPPILPLPARPGAFVRTEDILAHHLRKIFKIYQIEEQAVVSVTRNADISYDEAMDQEDLDLRAQMTKLLRQRERLAPVRLEMQGEAPALQAMLLRRLRLTAEQSYVCTCPLVLKYAYQLDSLDSLMEQAGGQKNATHSSAGLAGVSGSGNAHARPDSAARPAAVLSLPLHAAVSGPAAPERRGPGGGVHSDDHLPGGREVRRHQAPVRRGGERQGRDGAGGAAGPL